MRTWHDKNIQLKTWAFNFMETLQRGALKLDSAVNYLIPLLLYLKKISTSKKKNLKTLKQKRKKPNCWLKSKRFLEKRNLLIWNQKYNDNPFST